MTSSEEVLFPERTNFSEAEAAEHDLVLNDYIAAEKTARAYSELVKSGIASRSAAPPISSTTVAILTSVICGCNFIFMAANPDNPLAWIICVALWVFIVYRFSQHRGVPTNLLIDGEGLRFLWRKKQTHASPLFRWDQVVSATIFQLPFFEENKRPEGRYLRLRIQNTSLSMHQQWWLWTAGAKLKHNYGLPFERGIKSSVFEIPLDAFTRDSDQRLLLDLVTKRLGTDMVGDALKLDAADVPSFTQLWLDEAQSFRRKNIESLESERLLQNGRYSVVERIASGGQATVYRALDHSQVPERLVVLKELILPVSAGSDVRKRSFENVKNEALLLGSLNHPGIIKLIDNFIEDHRAYLVLEHVDGITLRDMVERDGPLSEETVYSILDQLCDIFGYLHGQAPPVVHRDFSPDNLMMISDGRVKLLDFNVALQSESTATKTVVGKHHYIAPEQFRGKPCTQSDLYSIGASLYFFRTGKDPVSLKTASLAEAGLEANALDLVVKKLTAMELSDRFRSIDDVTSALQQDMQIEQL